MGCQINRKREINMSAKSVTSMQPQIYNFFHNRANFSKKSF